MVSSAVKVVLRARPGDGPCPLQFAGDKKSVTINHSKAQEGKPRPTADNQPQAFTFKFDNVLSNATQEEVYEICASEVLKSAMEGYNGTVMCYGQTGAGKTFSMFGGRQNYKTRGIIPRLLGQLFTELRGMQDFDASISISFLEIYNESLFDLLDITTQPHEINVYENRQGLVTVNGLRTVAVASESEALALLFEGETNRVIGEHQLNRESSRSHSIFTVTLTLRPKNDASGDALVSKVALVDLAGSERVSKTRSEGLVLREAGNINKSLSILEQVILGLGDKGRDHVPFRSSKLTHVLKNSLGGNCKTVLIANVWSDTNQVDETISTCRFAQRMSRVTCEVSANVVTDTSARAKQLEKQVTELQQELAMHDAMANRSGITYSAYSEAQRADLNGRVRDFLNSDVPDSIEPLELSSLRHMREILYAARAIFNERARGGGAGPGPGSLAAPAGASAGGAAGAKSAGATGAAAAGAAGGVKKPGDKDKNWPEYGVAGAGGGVGELDGGGGGGAGVAPDDARPGSGGGGEDPTLVDQLMRVQTSALSTSDGVAPDKRTAFDDYKAGPGAPKAAMVLENKAKLKGGKKKAKELAMAINAAKRELDALKDKSEQLKAARTAAGGGGAADGDDASGAALGQEEYDALMRMKDLKGQYREQYNELQVAKSEVDYTQGLSEQLSKELMLEFNDWYLATYGRPAGLTGEDMHDGADGEGPSPRHSHAGAPGGPGLSPLAGSAPPGSGKKALPPLARGAAGAGAGVSGRGAGGVPSPMAAQKAAAVPVRKQVLSSLVPSQEEQADPEAMAYYSAQTMLINKTVGVAHRPGSVKKDRKPTSFGVTHRTEITDKIHKNDVAGALHPNRKPNY